MTATRRHKKILTRIAGFALLALFVFEPIRAEAATEVYSVTESRQLTQGVTYTKRELVTDAGLLDVYILSVNLNQPYVRIEPVNSAEFGLKETVTNMLSAEGAIAGVNGDFFGVSGTHSVPLGVEVKAGQVYSLSDLSNKNGEDSASLFINKFGAPSIGFLKSTVSFVNQGKENINVAAINRITDLSSPAVITSAAMKDTAALDKRIPNSLKIVVRNGCITKVSAIGETVDIPADGYVVIMNEAAAKEKKSLFRVGETAELRTSYSVDLSAVNFAVSGSDIILKNGEIVANNSALATNRHPRTAIGYNKDKTVLYLMVVDGRTHSIGATFEELARLMIKAGAYEAVNLDGGGSSTMAVVPVGGEDMDVVNTLSDGNVRKVINAVGIFNDAPIGPAVKLVMAASAEAAAVNSSVSIDVYGLDAYNHRIELPEGEVKLSVTGGKAEISSLSVRPKEKGVIGLKAEYGGLNAAISFSCGDIAELVPGVKEILTAVGKETPLSFRGIDENGKTLAIDDCSITYELNPPDMGRIDDNGAFISTSAKSGYIKCSLGAAVYYIPVSATLTPVKEFNLAKSSFNTSFYPQTGIFANAYAGQDGETVEFIYIFSESEVTQAAYLNFEPKLELPADAVGLSLVVSGDNSGNWLRGRVTDANGKQYTVDFERTMSFSGNKTVFAELPADAARPLSLDRIYIASLSQSFGSGSLIRFSKLTALKAAAQVDIELPANTKYRDGLLFEYKDGIASGQDITILPSMRLASDKRAGDYLSLRAKAISVASANSQGIIYLDSEADMADAKGFRYSKTADYNAFGFRDSQVITLNTAKGGIIATDVNAWPQLESSIIYTYTNNIIINTDISPLAFKSQKEFERLHAMLKKYADSGKNIFVISPDSDVNDVVLLDGIRYVRMVKMYADDGSLNDNFAALRLRLVNGAVRYRFDKVFE